MADYFRGSKSRVILTPAAMKFIRHNNGEEFGLDIEKDFPLLNEGISLRQTMMYLIYIIRFKYDTVPNYDYQTIVEELEAAESKEEIKQIMSIFKDDTFSPSEGLAEMLNSKSTYRIENGESVINNDPYYNVNMYVDDRSDSGFDGNRIKTTDVMMLFNSVIYNTNLPLPTNKKERERYDNLLRMIPETRDENDSFNDELIDEYNRIVDVEKEARKYSYNEEINDLKKIERKLMMKFRKY